MGRVIENKRDPDDLLAHVRVQVSAQLDCTRQLLVLWFNPGHPAAPPRDEMLESLPPPSIADPVTQEAAKPAAANATPAPKDTTPARPAPTAGPHPATPPRPAPRPVAGTNATSPAPPAAQPEPQ